MTDQAGGKLPHAPVLVSDLGTGVQRSTITNQDGFYAFPTLPIGVYVVSVEQSGFKPYRRTGLRIDANSALWADITLELGADSETVSVTDSEMQVETAETQMGQTITVKALAVSRSDVCPALRRAGPFGESGIYTRAAGQVITGTRGAFSSAFGSVGYQKTMRTRTTMRSNSASGTVLVLWR